jgi:long-chain fatty acid transport protein
MIRTRFPILLLLLAVGVAPAALATNGYFMHGQGTASKAMAGASTALAQEALDADSNPAAAAFLDSGYSLSFALFSPNRDYRIEGAPSGYPQTFGLQPGAVSSDSKYFPMPALGSAFKLSEKSAMTINLTAHGGMNTNYHASTFYGGGNTGVDLSQMFLTTTYARKLGPNHALGFSLVLAGQRFKASGLQAFTAFSAEPECISNNGYDTSYGAGVRVGYLGHLSEKLSVGAAFAPRIRMSKFNKYCGLFAQEGRFDIPTAFNAGLAYQPIASVTLDLDYQRIHYSDVAAVGNPLFPALTSTQLGSDGGAGFGWNDINVYKLGVQWKANNVWTLRAGFSKADQTVPDSEVLFNILAPGVIEDHLTAGFSRALQRSPGRVNFAVMYAPSKTVSGANPLEIPGQQRINLRMHEWEVEVGYSIGF